MEAKDFSGIYLANFALAHSLDIDLSGRDEYFRKKSETVRFWRDLLAKHKADGLKIDMKVCNLSNNLFVCLHNDITLDLSGLLCLMRCSSI